MIRGREPKKKYFKDLIVPHKVASNETKDSKLQQLKEEMAVSSYPRQGRPESSEEKVTEATKEENN